MVQCLKALSDLPEDPSLVPSTCFGLLTSAYKSSFWDMTPSSDFCGYTHICDMYSHRLININFLKNIF